MCGDAYRNKYRTNNRDRFREMCRYSKWKLKNDTIQAYGGCCVCCGETDLRFLTIDHINGRGSDKRMGEKLYIALKRQGFPKDNIQVLCWNCNSTKGLYGTCPHKEVSLVELVTLGKKLEFTASGTPVMVGA